MRDGALVDDGNGRGLARRVRKAAHGGESGNSAPLFHQRRPRGRSPRRPAAPKRCSSSSGASAGGAGGGRQCEGERVTSRFCQEREGALGPLPTDHPTTPALWRLRAESAVRRGGCVYQRQDKTAVPYCYARYLVRLLVRCALRHTLFNGGWHYSNLGSDLMRVWQTALTGAFFLATAAGPLLAAQPGQPGQPGPPPPGQIGSKSKGAPGPIAGAGLPILLVAGGYLLFRHYRNRRAELSR